MPFKPGQSGNPLGKKKGKASITHAILRRIEARQLAEKLADALLDQALEGNSASMKMVLDRVDGAVKQEADVTSNGQTMTGTVQIVRLPSNGRDEGT